MAEDDQGTGGVVGVVPARAGVFFGGRPGADGDEFLAAGAGQALFGVDAGVYEQEVVGLDIERDLPEPSEDLAVRGSQLGEGVTLVGLFQFGLASGGGFFQVIQEARVVVAQHDVMAPVTREGDTLGRRGAILDDVAKTPDFVGIAISFEDGLQALQVGVDVGDEQDLHRRQGTPARMHPQLRSSALSQRNPCIIAAHCDHIHPETEIANRWIADIAFKRTLIIKISSSLFLIP